MFTSVTQFFTVLFSEYLFNTNENISFIFFVRKESMVVNDWSKILIMIMVIRDYFF